MRSFDETSRLDGSFHPRSPHFQIANPLRLDEIVKYFGILPALFGEVGIPTNFALHIVLALAVLSRGENIIDDE